MKVNSNFRIFEVVVLVIATVVSDAFMMHKSNLRLRQTRSFEQLHMSSFSLQGIMGSIPLCLTPTSDTTVTNDPTAGMSPDQIEIYSNVGGGMCGYPEWVNY